MKLHIARLCWNEHGWSRPSGVAALSEGPAKGNQETFVSETGYGHEEWLFRPEHELDRYRYGFLQPSLKAGAHRYGEVLDVVLYTIDPDGTRWYLGRVDGIELLDDAEANRARQRMEKKGLLAAMRSDLADLGFSAAHLSKKTPGREIVNVRFRAGSVHMLPAPRAAKADDPLRRPGKNRYQFYPLESVPGRIEGTLADPRRPTGPYQYTTAPLVSADRRHNRIQLQLAKVLREKYGEAAVELEVGGVDILLRRPGGTAYIEVKSDADPRLALRAALGQVLEYALFASATTKSMPQLVVAAPGAPDSTVVAYLATLQARFGLPLLYIQADESLSDCPL